MKKITLDVLTTPGCIHCDEFLDFWQLIAGEWPNVTMREISIITIEGQVLARKHQMFAAPSIIVNDEVFASGGFNTVKFVEKIRELSI
ncbi:MAG: Glutaredoxin/thioredoxin-like protein [Parcubacteria group bacterium GW2011_GWA2_47_7]|nr:MAG: Glutaredoxin/thioredoxin-like protein [Parcubacteria group bacterium GW2011_GWA2_47_7]